MTLRNPMFPAPRLPSCEQRARNANAKAQRAALAAGKTTAQAVMDGALAAVACASDTRTHVEILTDAVRHIIAAGPTVETRVRFGGFALTVEGMALDRACYEIERLRRAEFAAHDRSAALWGRSQRSRLDLSVLTEARLALRWMRRHAAARWPATIEALVVPSWHRVAAE